MKDSKIERARKLASDLPFHKGEQRVWAVITNKRGKILSEAGNNYRKSSPVMKKFGISGTVRVSFAFYNTFEEIDYFITNLKKAISMLQ